MGVVCMTAEEQLASMTKVLQVVLDDPRNKICTAYRLTLMGLIDRAEATLKALDNPNE